MAYSPHFSSRGHFNISRHEKKGEHSAVRYLGRETTFTHILFITILYNSILLLVIAHLLLCLIYELNFITGVYS